MLFLAADVLLVVNIFNWKIIVLAIIDEQGILNHSDF